MTDESSIFARRCAVVAVRTTAVLVLAVRRLHRDSALSPSWQTCLSRAGRAPSRALTGGQPQRSGVAHRDWPPPMAAVHKGLCSRPCQGSHVRERKVERIHAVHGANVVAVSQTSHSPHWGMHFSSNGGANALVCTVSDSGGAAGGRGPVVLVTSGVRCFSPTTLRCRISRVLEAMKACERVHRQLVHHELVLRGTRVCIAYRDATGEKLVS